MLPDQPQTSERNMILPNITMQTTQSLEFLAIGKMGATNTFEKDSTRTYQTQSAHTSNESTEPDFEKIIPSIYLSKNFLTWNEKKLRTNQFTHIVRIDKHIQELYYPSPIFELSADNNNYAFEASAFESSWKPRKMVNTKNTTEELTKTSLSFSKEFQTIDLNFGEKSYLTSVLPNCYRAVKYLSKALQSDGKVLVIDCNGGEQKCVTVVVAFLMYKYNISFSSAFARLKEFYKKADLDRFYISQLYEYEPILQVQRAQSRGQSCSRQLNSAMLKRKKAEDEYVPSAETIATDPKEFFNMLNPLTQFNIKEDNLKNLQEQHSKCSIQSTPVNNAVQSQHQNFQLMTTNNRRNNNSLDDYDME